MADDGTGDPRARARRGLLDLRPLDRITSIKLKLGLVIVIAVAVSATVSQLGFVLGIPVWFRPFIAVGISLLLVQVLAHGMTSPLREMEHAASRMAEGDYDQRVTATASDEVGRLAVAFNAMAQQLSEVDRQRRDLIANVSHELRTPLSALQATLENLVDGVEEVDPERLRTMLAQTERLSRLVTQLLDLSRLESGASPLHRARFDLQGMLDEAAAETRLHRPDLCLSVEVDPPGLDVDGDAERLHQVVANLLDNAARHSDVGERVDVSARRRGGEVVIEVADRGPGIPPDERSRVFERFYRADAARTTVGGGAGLGLAIARWIVDLHGGDIRADTGSPHGCRMVIELPQAGCEREEERVAVPG